MPGSDGEPRVIEGEGDPRSGQRRRISCWRASDVGHSPIAGPRWALAVSPSSASPSAPVVAVPRRSAAEMSIPELRVGRRAQGPRGNFGNEAGGIQSGSIVFVAPTRASATPRSRPRWRPTSTRSPSRRCHGRGQSLRPGRRPADRLQRRQRRQARLRAVSVDPTTSTRSRRRPWPRSRATSAPRLDGVRSSSAVSVRRVRAAVLRAARPRPSPSSS